MTEYIVDVQFASDFNADNMRHFELDVRSRKEVVRCRDCKHFTPKGADKFENGKTNMDYCTYIRGWMLQITPDGFCAWGDRRD